MLIRKAVVTRSGIIQLERVNVETCQQVYIVHLQVIQVNHNLKIMFICTSYDTYSCSELIMVVEFLYKTRIYLLLSKHFLWQKRLHHKDLFDIQLIEAWAASFLCLSCIKYTFHAINQSLQFVCIIIMHGGQTTYMYTCTCMCALYI